MTMISASASRPPLGHHHDHHDRLRPDAAVRDLEDRRGARTTLSHFDDSSDDGFEMDDDHDMQTPTSLSNHSHIPLHPIPSMQEAFAESLEEATKSELSQKPKLREQDPKQRRETLLDQDRSQGPPNRLWRFRPGQRCHELRKLVAQISFGIELLIKGMANSDAQVLSILQGHIDEVDEFLEAAMEDVQQATLDLKQRLDFLKVPLENMNVFEQMLENRKFRLQIVEGNVKIEHILSRTSTAHAQTIRDVSEGLWGVKQFSQYLKDNERGAWRQDRPDVVDVFEAMKGNTEGWYSAFTTLESNSTLLSGLLVQLSSLVVDIDKKAGEVSRRTRFTMEPYSEPDGRSMPRSPESPSQATPPPSPPTSKPEAAPRIQTILFDNSIGSFLQDPESSNDSDLPARSNKQRITKDSDTLRDTMLANHLYTPPESSRTIPEVNIEQAHLDDDSESQSVIESQTSNETESSNATDDDDNLLYILQPRTYTPIPPAPIPSPRVSDVQAAAVSTARISIPSRGSPDELSIHIEAEEEIPQLPDDQVRETVLTVPQRDARRVTSETAQPKPLQIQPLQVKPLKIQQVRSLQAANTTQRQSRSSDKEVVLGHKTSLRERVSLKGEVPKAIHVPPVNAHEFQRPRYPTPQGSPRSQNNNNNNNSNNNQNSNQHQQPPGSSRGPDMPRHPDAFRRHQTTMGNLDYNAPVFPSLLPSPASERQHFRPVQASPHSPLQQRPHTAGTVHRPRLNNQNTSSTLSRVMSSTTTTMGGGRAGGESRADSTRTVKKKRSAFGWLKKAFSLDEEERAMFEARKRAMPVNYYAPMQNGGYAGGNGSAMEAQSPRFLDGRRIA